MTIIHNTFKVVNMFLILKKISNILQQTRIKILIFE